MKLKLSSNMVEVPINNYTKEQLERNIKACELSLKYAHNQFDKDCILCDLAEYENRLGGM